MQLDLGLLDLATKLHEEDTWLREEEIVCVVPKLQGLVSKCKNPAPQGEKLPIDQDDHWLGSLEWDPTTGGRCGDRRAYQAGVIRIPPTNFTSMDVDVDVDVDVNM
jgi:hypothetical protein